MRIHSFSFLKGFGLRVLGKFQNAWATGLFSNEITSCSSFESILTYRKPPLGGIAITVIAEINIVTMQIVTVAITVKIGHSIHKSTRGNTTLNPRLRHRG